MRTRVPTWVAPSSLGGGSGSETPPVRLPDLPGGLSLESGNASL